MMSFMDTDAPTQTAEPQLDATMPASTQDATQSIAAWSQEDDYTELAVQPHQRSWKIPITLAALAAAAAITTGTIQLWPHPTPPAGPTTSAPTIHPPKAAAPPTQPPQTPDQEFLALLRKRDIDVINPTTAINAAHGICTSEKQGEPDQQIAQELANGSPGLNLDSANVFVITSHEVYCRNTP